MSIVPLRNIDRVYRKKSEEYNNWWGNSRNMASCIISIECIVYLFHYKQEKDNVIFFKKQLVVLYFRYLNPKNFMHKLMSIVPLRNTDQVYRKILKNIIQFSWEILETLRFIQYLECIECLYYY